MIENKERKLWEFYVFHLSGLILYRKTIGHRKEKARLKILASLIHDKLAKVFEHFNLLYNFNLIIKENKEEKS